MAKKLDIKLTESEVRHLLSLLFENEKEGWYFGNREQYWKRHKRIKEKLITTGNGQ